MIIILFLLLTDLFLLVGVRDPHKYILALSPPSLPVLRLTLQTQPGAGHPLAERLPAGHPRPDGDGGGVGPPDGAGHPSSPGLPGQPLPLPLAGGL